MTTTQLKPRQVVTFYPRSGRGGIPAEVLAIRQASPYRPAVVRFRYRPHGCRRPRVHQLPLSLFTACMEPRE